MLFLTCTIISSVELARYRVSVDCGTRPGDPFIDRSNIILIILIIFDEDHVRSEKSLPVNAY